MKIQGKSALVTGGASGLGAATVRMLAAAGAYVTIADLNDQAGAALSKELSSSVDFIKTDVTQEKQIADPIQQAVTPPNPPHILLPPPAPGLAAKMLAKNAIPTLPKIAQD